MRGRSGLSARGSSSRMGKSSKDFSDDVSLTSMDPSIRDFVDWDEDDNFSVDETTIAGLDPVADNQDKNYDSVSKLEVVQEEVDGDQEQVEQSADVDRDRDRARTVDDGNDSGNDDDGDGSMEEVKLNSMSEIDSRSAATVKRKNPHNDDDV